VGQSVVCCERGETERWALQCCVLRGGGEAVRWAIQCCVLIEGRTLSGGERFENERRAIVLCCEGRDSGGRYIVVC